MVRLSIPALALLSTLGLTAVDADALERCNRDAGTAVECRDTNAGTAMVSTGQFGPASASQKTVQPRDAASGMATGKRSHKPLR
jgi:hypothetical protein